MKLADSIWLLAIAILGAYEIWALATGHTTLSRAVWTANHGQYGSLLPLLVGILIGHFFWSGQ